jgi:hypothetical protein
MSLKGAGRKRGSSCSYFADASQAKYSWIEEAMRRMKVRRPNAMELAINAFAIFLRRRKKKRRGVIQAKGNQEKRTVKMKIIRRRNEGENEYVIESSDEAG